MTSKSVLALMFVTLVTPNISSLFAEQISNEVEWKRQNGHQVLVEVPYHNLTSFPIPSVANKAQAESEYATTLVHFTDAAGERRFVISLSASRSLDAQRLRLITKAKDNAFVPGLSFSVSSKLGRDTQLITFIGRFTGNIRLLDRLLVIQMPRPDQS